MGRSKKKVVKRNLDAELKEGGAILDELFASRKALNHAKLQETSESKIGRERSCRPSEQDPTGVKDVKTPCNSKRMRTKRELNEDWKANFSNLRGSSSKKSRHRFHLEFLRTHTQLGIFPKGKQWMDIGSTQKTNCRSEKAKVLRLLLHCRT